MDGNTELLNYIYQNSQMGIETIEQLLGVVEDTDFKNHLQAQLGEYKDINQTALQKIKALGHEEKGIGKMTKISAYMSIGIQTLKDKSPSHISEMMIEGSTMGVIDATKNIKKYQDANADILQLADKLLKTEQNNIEQLKNFLA